MSTVYAVTRCKPHQDLTPATEFGDIKYIFDGNDSWRDVLKDLGHMIEVSETAFEDFDPDEDYFLPIGDMTLVTLCVSALSRKCGDNLYSLLVWNPRKGNYEAVRI